MGRRTNDKPKGLVINYGEGGRATKWEGWQLKFYPYKKGGGVSAILKGRTKSFEVVLTWELKVLAILKGAQNVSTL